MAVDISKLNRHDVARKLDFAILDKAGLETDNLKGCRDVQEYNFIAFHVLPCWIPLVVREIGSFARENAIEIGAPVSFPYGTALGSSKASEAEGLIEEGATALDMVANIGWLKDRRFDLYEAECREHIGLCHDAGINGKVIIEIGYLSDEQIATATQIVAQAGADFVKTATGTGPPGRPNFHDYQLIRDTLDKTGTSTGIKVSGIVEPRILNAYSFIRLGADRIGTRAAPQIVQALPRVRNNLYL